VSTTLDRNLIRTRTTSLGSGSSAIELRSELAQGIFTSEPGDYFRRAGKVPFCSLAFEVLRGARQANAP
jgi:hypothetical protein